MAGSPLVSCILLTRNRRRLVSQAIWCFFRQDYPARELIVVDDGDDAVADLMPVDPRIRYVRTQLSAAGAKRNHACELAHGQFIAHWDDDTWYSPQRLTAQLHELQQAGTDAGALGGLLHYQPLTGRLWQQANGPRPGTPHPGTLVYRREFWKAHRFPDNWRGGLSDFVRWMSSDTVAVKDRADLAVAVLHGSSTGPVNPADPCWQSRPFDDLRQVLALDLNFYAALRGDGGLAGPCHTLAPITVAATFMVYDGYGSMAEYLAVGMARAGAEVHIAPFRIDPAAASPEFRELLQRSRPNPDGVVLCHAWWGENLARFGSAHDLFIKTVWETSRLPEDWPARLSGARAIIVPSDFAAHVFRESGVQTPIEVAYEGIDPAVYPYLERPERPGLTTLIVGVLAPRKNFRQAVAAWQAAFVDDPDARLILKARFQVDRFVTDDPRIRVIDSNEATRGILHWYRQADLLLALGNEGFGLPMVEAMATGLPVVVLDAEAQADVVAATRSSPARSPPTDRGARGPGGSLVLPVKVAAWEDVDSPVFGPAGVRALPDVADAARQLRWVADHRDEARAMGRAASAWAHTNRNVWDMGPATLAAIERHARTPRPLRRTYAIWAPDRAGSKEITDYVRTGCESAGRASAWR